MAQSGGVRQARNGGSARTWMGDNTDGQGTVFTTRTGWRLPLRQEVAAIPLSEADTHDKLVNPALYGRGWTEAHIKREQTVPPVEIVGGKGHRHGKGRTDVTLRVRVNTATQPVAVAVVEVKAADNSPSLGLDQAKRYCDRLHVPFAYSTNGHRFVEYDAFTGQTSEPRQMATEFPRPEDLCARFEAGKGFSLADPAARPLLVPYTGGEAERRYYQDAAIRAVFEKVARGEKRALLSLATGAGKTRIAVWLLHRIAQAGQLRRALFVCDRDELRSQAQGALHNVFGADSAEVKSGEPQKNARILVATYQTLDVDSEEADANFLTANYPENYFSHIIIDECHRSAWGKWSRVLTRNLDAVQIGLTATPRQIKVSERTPETEADEALTHDNIKHFGEPVYVYALAQGIEDGYLAPCEIVRRDVFLERKASPEWQTGVDRTDLEDKKLVDHHTGEAVEAAEARARYSPASFEARLVMPERAQVMCQDLFANLLATGTPEQKSIVFCASDDHAQQVAGIMDSLYEPWCLEQGQEPKRPYAFKCTAKAEDPKAGLTGLKSLEHSYFIATTVDLLTTGIDVPCVQNIVFFKYVKSPIAFYQMVGRGSRIDENTGKLMFRVYDYTDATRLFPEDFITKPVSKPSKPQEPGPDGPKERIIEAHGITAYVTDAGVYVPAIQGGVMTRIPLEQYKQDLAAKLVQEARTLDGFRDLWIGLQERRALLQSLPAEGRSAELVRRIEEKGDFDLFDVLADLAWGMEPLTRTQRADAFLYKHDEWLRGLPEATAATVRALVAQFARAGTDGLETPRVFEAPEVRKAGGLAALKLIGQSAAEILREMKRRVFAA